MQETDADSRSSLEVIGDVLADAFERLIRITS